MELQVSKKINYSQKTFYSKVEEKEQKLKKMKKVNTLTLALLMTLSLSAFIARSANNSPTVAVHSSAEKTISNFFKFPKVLMPYTEQQSSLSVKVEVIFVTDKDGKVTYSFAKTKDQKLKQEIEKQFSALKLTDIKENVAHSVILNFKYIES